MNNIIYLKENLIPKKCFLGISINKPFINEFWEKQIDYLNNNYDDIIILIADEIDVINQVNIENKDIGEAKINIKNKFNLWKTYLNKKIKDKAKNSKDTVLGYEGTKNKFKFVSWHQISSTKRFKEVYSALTNKYLNNSEFKKCVWNILEKYLNARNKKDIINNSLLDNLSPYIINELVTLIDGIDYKGDNYNCIVYPTFKETIGGMNNLAEQIYNEIGVNINLRGKVLIESSF